MSLTQNLRTPLLVFGGPYANLRALTALRARAVELGIDARRTVCTGDIVAYCAEPEETVAAIREWGCRAIAGNCEEQLELDAEDCGCGLMRTDGDDVILSTHRLAYDHLGASARLRDSGHANGYARSLITSSPLGDPVSRP